MELEVLVATMQQQDCSLAEKMNLWGHAVIANQCGRWDYTEQETEYGRIRMISTATKGVGINRNLALQLAQGDILLFADDDLVYYDDGLQGVAEAFAQLPQADVIVFGLDMTRNGEIFERRRHKVEQRHLWNALRFGGARIAIRREAVLRHRLMFSTLFGGGCRYGSGEDSLFLIDCFRAGLKVYSHSHVLGTCAKDGSSWFHGYDEKFMFDKGAFLACGFPRGKHLLKWYFARKYAAKSAMDLKSVVRHMNRGISAFSSLQSFEEAGQGLEKETR